MCCWTNRSNRNRGGYDFFWKQELRRKTRKGDIFLASPETVAASLLAGYITTVDAIPKKPTSNPVVMSLNTSSNNDENGVKNSSLLNRDGTALLYLTNELIFVSFHLTILCICFMIPNLTRDLGYI
jgi:hypothetical protein